MKQMPKQTAPVSPTDLVKGWLKEWQTFKDEKAYDKGLLSILPKFQHMFGAQTIDTQTEVDMAAKVAARFLHFYALFVSNADIELVKQKFQMICHIKPALGPIMDTARESSLPADQFWKKYAQPAEGATLELVRAYAFITLGNIHAFPGKNLLKHDPQYMGPLVFGCLAQRYVLTKQQSENKKWLLSNCEHFEGIDFPGYGDSMTSLAWMYCSYIYWPERHRIKASINRIYTRWMTERRIVEKPSDRPRLKKTKPTILIFAEKFSNHHAMFRCHGKSAVALRDRFRTILMTDLNGVEPATRKMFSKVVQYDNGPKRVDKNAKTIRKFRPDMIYYPSVGMNRNSTYLANLRLAPIQFLSMGHPASTFSPEMDYVVVNNDLRPDPKCFTEKVIHRRQSSGYSPYPGWQPDQMRPSLPTSGKRKRVGVLGFLPKVTYEFLEVCEKLRSSTPDGVEFHFFPNAVTIDAPGFRASVLQMLPDAVFHERQSYENYMNDVAAMDMIFSTFPFGNTNGTIDALLARRPILALDGPEPHARTDARLLKKVGAPGEMLVTSRQEFYDTAHNWLNNEDKLMRITAAVKALDVEGTFFAPEEASDFDEVVSLLYDTHEQLQADDRREFEFEELQQISQTLKAETAAN